MVLESKFPDFIGDRIWALAWVVVEQKQYPHESVVSYANFRFQQGNSNLFMNFIALEENIEPKLETEHTHYKRYASGLEIKLGRMAEQHSLDTAINYAVRLIEKYTDFKMLEKVSYKERGRPMTKIRNKNQVRRFLILADDCF